MLSVEGGEQEASRESSSNLIKYTTRHQTVLEINQPKQESVNENIMENHDDSLQVTAV